MSLLALSASFSASRSQAVFLNRRPAVRLTWAKDERLWSGQLLYAVFLSSSDEAHGPDRTRPFAGSDTRPHGIIVLADTKEIRLHFFCYRPLE
jgi:hypothetical protein